MTRIPASEVLDRFRAALIARDIVPPDPIIADGQLHRCNAAGARGRGDAAYLLHLDGLPAGGMENWRDGLGWQAWRMDIGRTLSAAEREAFRLRAQDASVQRCEEVARLHEHAQQRAARIWAAARPAPADHPYLARKGVQAHGLRVYRGALLVPARDATGVLHGLQFIGASGTKRILRGARVQGMYYLIGEQADDACGESSDAGRDVVCVVEGFATGASVHEAAGHTVAVAFHAGNLAAVARAVRDRHPQAGIVVCADEDRDTPGNPGFTHARQAALAVGGLVATPDFGPDRPAGASDFNDLHRHRGLSAVLTAVHGAGAPSVGMVGAEDVVRWHLHEARRLLAELDAPPALAAAIRLDTWLLNEARATGSPRVPTTRVYQYGPACVRDSRDLKAALATLTERGRARLRAGIASCAPPILQQTRAPKAHEPRETGMRQA